jgi:hypothetical protein
MHDSITAIIDKQIHLGSAWADFDVDFTHRLVMF